MTRSARSHFLSAVVGGLVVGAGLLVFGAAGRGHTETIIDEAPVASQPVAGTSGGPSGLTAHDIYQRDAPGVVYVQAKLVAPTESPFNMFHARESTTSTGSGFLVDRRGDVLTDYHVVDGADRSGGVTGLLQGDMRRRASVIAVDPSSDLAVLHLDVRGLPSVRPLQHRLQASDGQAIDNVIQTDQPIDAGNAGRNRLRTVTVVLGSRTATPSPDAH